MLILCTGLVSMKTGELGTSLSGFQNDINRDALWKMTKDSKTCQDAVIRFVEDLHKEVKDAREMLWPSIKQARQEGKKAYFRGPYGYINGLSYHISCSTFRCFMLDISDRRNNHVTFYLKGT